VNTADIDARLAPLRDVRLVSYDRAFPHTAKIVVSAERPVAVLRHGSQAWIVTERGRVLEPIGDPAESDLPRIWDADAAVPSAGALLSADEALRPARLLGGVLSADPALFKRIREATFVEGDLSLVLGTGTAIRLGDAGELALKLTVAEHVLAAAGPGMQYVDVSVPERAVVH
jgi:cell division septal protein FtsQ